MSLLMNKKGYGGGGGGKARKIKGLKQVSD